MKRIISIFCMSALMSLSLIGCASGGSEGDPMVGEKTSSIPQTTKKVSGFATGDVSVGAEYIAMDNENQMRKTELASMNSIECVTSMDQLKKYAWIANGLLDSYEESFFEDKALVFATITVTSGSTKLSFGDAKVVNNVVLLGIKTERPTLGTNDMATFLLWAEMDQKYADCTWQFADKYLQDNTGVRE